jgi:hypothetical protein
MAEMGIRSGPDAERAHPGAAVGHELNESWRTRAVETHNRIRGSFELHSSWPLPNEAYDFWITTKADRSTTTFPLPSEFDRTVS